MTVFDTHPTLTVLLVCGGAIVLASLGAALRASVLLDRLDLSGSDLDDDAVALHDPWNGS